MRRAAGLLAALALLGALILGARWLWVATSVGAGFAAKVTCSLVFVSGQPARDVLDDYVLREVSPLGPVLEVEVEGRQVVSRVLGVTRARAVHRPGLGCTQLYGDGAPTPVALPPPRALDPSLPWPRGRAGPTAPPPPAVQAAIDRAFAEPGAPDGYRRQTRAIVVARRGRLVAERYAPGYGPATPMLSWSMAKSVIATLVGLADEDGLLELRAPAPVPEWRGDPRSAITLDQLLRMSSGLRFDESYGPTSDASVMLFARPDVAAFAAAMPLDAPPDRVWSYSSGTTNLVSRTLRDAVGGDVAALAGFARRRLFDPADITSARLEVDASGTPIGSSFVFMTARDWARFGELHRRGGVWRGRRVLPEGWVEYVTTPTPAALRGNYGAHWWLNAGSHDGELPWPSLPTDLFVASGYSGQYVMVIPSAELVVVRLGLSVPSESPDQHGVSALVAELIDFYGGDGP